LIVFRIGQAVRNRPLLRAAWWLMDRLYLRLLVGCELPASVQCGDGLRLPHMGRGVIVHTDARIGANVTLWPRVTIGTRGDRPPPVIADDVYVGTGACILGDVAVGQGAHVGSNAVVMSDLPPWCVAGGVPATVKRGAATQADDIDRSDHAPGVHP
jgi:serine O-acetyltransferase